jgi:hypothetical protein
MKNGQLCRFTHFALQLNPLIDSGPVREPTFSEIHEAAKGGRLVELVASCSDHPASYVSRFTLHASRFTLRPPLCRQKCVTAQKSVSKEHT